MPLLDDQSHCSGYQCPSKDICRRYPAPGEVLPPRAVMAALWVRRPVNDAACDEYLERDAEPSA